MFWRPQTRCHVVQIVLTSRDTKLLERLIFDVKQDEVARGGQSHSEHRRCGSCLHQGLRHRQKRHRTLLTQSSPSTVQLCSGSDHYYKEGEVKHIHFLSAFPDQAKAITDALLQWEVQAVPE